VVEVSDYAAAATTGQGFKNKPKGGGAGRGRGGGGGGRGGGPGAAAAAAAAAAADENRPCCLCGEHAAQRTTTKEGPNKGRVFWVCPKVRLLSHSII